MSVLAPVTKYFGEQPPGIKSKWIKQHKHTFGFVKGTGAGPKEETKCMATSTEALETLISLFGFVQGCAALVLSYLDELIKSRVWT